MIPKSEMRQDALRAMEKINYTTLLAFRPVFSVAASGEYVRRVSPQYLPAKNEYLN